LQTFFCYAGVNNHPPIC